MVKLQIGGNSDNFDVDNGNIEVVESNDDTVKSDTEISREMTTATTSGLQNHQLVREVNVGRGREVIAAHSGYAGSLCLVVRRPG